MVLCSSFLTRSLGQYVGTIKNEDDISLCWYKISVIVCTVDVESSRRDAAHDKAG
jgi:hypothetical protein